MGCSYPLPTQILREKNLWVRSGSVLYPRPVSPRSVIARCQTDRQVNKRPRSFLRRAYPRVRPRLRPAPSEFHAMHDKRPNTIPREYACRVLLIPYCITDDPATASLRTSDCTVIRCGSDFRAEGFPLERFSLPRLVASSRALLRSVPSAMCILEPQM